jgi:hypothetical protein
MASTTSPNASQPTPNQDTASAFLGHRRPTMSDVTPRLAQVFAPAPLPAHSYTASDTSYGRSTAHQALVQSYGADTLALLREEANLVASDRSAGRSVGEKLVQVSIRLQTRADHDEEDECDDGGDFPCLQVVSAPHRVGGHRWETKTFTDQLMTKVSYTSMR